MDIEALKKGAVGKRLDELKDMRKKRREKLKEQNREVARLKEVLNKYNLDSKRVIKSVEAAVTVSQQAGYIEYAEHTDAKDTIAASESIARIKQLEKDLKHLDREIKRQEKENKHAWEEGDAVKPSSFSEWFAANGRPRSQMKGMLSQFKPERSYVNHYGIDDTGKPTKRTAQKRSNGITMVRGKLIA